MTTQRPTEEPTVTVEVAEPDDWRVWRDLRHRALSTDPDVFGAALTQERGHTEQEWRTRLAGGRCVVARLDGEPVGMGGSFEAGAGVRAGGGDVGGS